MPSISVACIAMALKAIFAMVVLGATGVAVVGFTNDYSFGFTGTPFPSPVQQKVQFTANFNAEQCPTCLHVQQLSDNKPSPTLHLKTSYAAPHMFSKPKPTPPPTTREVTSAPRLSFISRVIAPSRGASTLAASSVSYQNLLRYLTNLAFALASSTPWVIIYKVIWRLSFMTTLVVLITLPNSCQRCLQLPTKTKEMLGKVTAIILASFHNPEMLLSIEGYKARINGTPNLEFRRPRKVYADIPMAFYEQYLFATADIEPSFGPSIQNAETEFRSRLERVEGNIGKQADIVAFFRKTLDSFTRALAAAEATTEGRETRYMTVIQDQDRLIDELRILHEYREQAFRENEDLVEWLCQIDKDGNPPKPKRCEQKPPFDNYSAGYDKFVISPMDGPATLSMKVSVLSAPFHRRPVTILDSDPYWQRFLESTAEKQSEQEARLASLEDDVINCGEQEEEYVKEKEYVKEEEYVKEKEDLNEEGGVEDGCVQGTCDVSQSEDDEYLDKTEGGDDIGGNDIGVNDAESLDGALKLAKSNLAWYEWKLACMKGTKGNPRGSDSKQFSDIPSAITARVDDDIAEFRQAQEMEWAECPKHIAIDACELSIDVLKVEIAHMKSNATSEGRTRGRKGEALAEPTTAGDSPLS